MSFTLVWVFKILIAGKLVAVPNTDVFLTYEACAEALDRAVFEPAPKGVPVCAPTFGVVFDGGEKI